MNIVYSSSDSYAEIAGISMDSLLKNNQSMEDIQIFMIDNAISTMNRARLDSIAQTFGREIRYISKPDVQAMAGTQINVGRWNIATFYRLFLPSILPQEIDRVLFIDCDTLILQDLTPLWEMDMGDKWLYGVDDCRGAAYRTNLNLKPEDNYINNGVMLIDLKAWRENNVETMFLDFIRAHRGDITFVDQGVQNGVLSGINRSGLLHPKYNCLTIFFAFSYQNLIRLRQPPVPMDEHEYRQAVGSPAIVHFQSCFRLGLRPWTKGCKHPYTDVYLHYKRRTPWKDEPLRPDDRTFAQKALNLLAISMPETWMVSVISVLHTKLYPLMRDIKQSVKHKKLVQE